MGVSELWQPRPIHHERCATHLRLHWHAVLESGTHAGDQGSRSAFIIAKNKEKTTVFLTKTVVLLYRGRRRQLAEGNITALWHGAYATCRGGGGTYAKLLYCGACEVRMKDCFWVAMQGVERMRCCFFGGGVNEYRMRRASERKMKRGKSLLKSSAPSRGRSIVALGFFHGHPSLHFVRSDTLSIGGLD